jgi:hypothetical protein
VPGGRVRLLANGRLIGEGGEGTFNVRFRPTPGENRVEVQVVGAQGPGAATFELRGGCDPTSLRVASGTAAPAGPRGIVALLRGRPGESFVLVFRAPADGRGR